MKYERVTKRTLAYVITYELWNYGESVLPRNCKLVVAACKSRALKMLLSAATHLSSMTCLESPHSGKFRTRRIGCAHASARGPWRYHACEHCQAIVTIDGEAIRPQHSLTITTLDVDCLRADHLICVWVYALKPFGRRSPRCSSTPPTEHGSAVVVVRALLWRRRPRGGGASHVLRSLLMSHDCNPESGPKSGHSTATGIRGLAR